MIKAWILRQKFVADYVKEQEKDFATRLFKNAREDVLEEIEVDVEARAEAIAEERLMKLLTLVDWTNVVRIDKAKGILLIGDERADEARLNNLKSEAEIFSSSELWKLLQETPKQLAYDALFKVSESLDDLKKGKAMLYTLDSQQNIVNIFKNYVKK